MSSSVKHKRKSFKDFRLLISMQLQWNRRGSMEKCTRLGTTWGWV